MAHKHKLGDAPKAWGSIAKDMNRWWKAYLRGERVRPENPPRCTDCWKHYWPRRPKILDAVIDYVAPLPSEKLEEMERIARKAKP